MQRHDVMTELKEEKNNSSKLEQVISHRKERNRKLIDKTKEWRELTLTNITNIEKLELVKLYIKFWDFL